MSEFSITEMEKYVNERVKENCSDSLEDFVAACIEYRIKSLGNVNVSITKTEISALIACDGDSSITVIAEQITKEYGIDIDCKKLGENFGKAYDVVSAVKDIVPCVIDVYNNGKVLKWTGCENVTTGSRGTNIDAARLAVIEKFYGRGFVGVNGANPILNYKKCA